MYDSAISKRKGNMSSRNTADRPEYERPTRRIGPIRMINKVISH